MAGGTAVRVRRKEVKWRRVVEGHPGSGLSIRAYCAQRGVREHGFYWWRSKLARRDADHQAAFVPVTVTAETPVPTPIGWVEIILPGDRRVRVTGPVDRRMLADVLAVLAAREGVVTC
jgi:hypothetical protein